MNPNNLSQQFEEHDRKDDLRFEETERKHDERFKKMEDTIATLATKQEMSDLAATLATKDDIREMKEAFQDFLTAVRLLREGSKWTYRALLVIASIVVAVIAIGGGLKTFIGWVGFSSMSK